MRQRMKEQTDFKKMLEMVFKQWYILCVLHTRIFANNTVNSIKLWFFSGFPYELTYGIQPLMTFDYGFPNSIQKQMVCLWYSNSECCPQRTKILMHFNKAFHWFIKTCFKTSRGHRVSKPPMFLPHQRRLSGGGNHMRGASQTSKWGPNHRHVFMLDPAKNGPHFRPGGPPGLKLCWSSVACASTKPHGAFFLWKDGNGTARKKLGRGES